jgi:uncharacterized membrane protein
MAFCANCGANMTDGTAFCASCGASVGSGGPIGGGAAAAVAGNAAPPMAAATRTGLTNNVAAALSYLLGAITGIIFLVIDPYKNDPFVKFHAFQSIFLNVSWIVFWIAWTIISMILSTVTAGILALIMLPIDLIIGLGFLCFWIFVMYKAYQNERYMIPIIGPIAAKQAGM